MNRDAKLTKTKDHDLYCRKCQFHASVFPHPDPEITATAVAALQKMHAHCKGQLEMRPIGSNPGRNQARSFH